MSSAPRYMPHYTVADYRLWEGDWELWQGTPVAMTPRPFGRHQELTVKLAAALLGAVEESGCEAKVLSEIDWIISEDTVVRPDVVVVFGGTPERHVETTPALVAEILSPGTSSRDRGEKRELYADHGVSYYFIVDPVADNYEAFALNQGQLVPIDAAPEITLSVCSSCELSFSMAKVLRQ